MRHASKGEDADDQHAFREAVQHTRGLVLAEALLFIVVGFTADDLELLRVPGYLLGLGLAGVTLAAGGLLHGWRLASKLEGLDTDARSHALAQFRTRGRLAAVAASVLFLIWLVLFAQGVPPWAL